MENKEKFELVNEIMENKDKLIFKANEIIKTESEQNLATFLDNHKKYSEIIKEYIERLTDTKLKLDNCIDILQQGLINNLPILEISISGQKIGTINNIQYIDTYDKVQNCHILQFDLKHISNKVKIISDTKRQIVFQMIYDGGMTIIYDVKFNLEKTDKNTGIVKGVFTSSKN